ncbi:MAG: hypothetical protein HYY18_14820 [Planctomycetes bacterium]|nr:hypothetical protein [Planctomycetota bacterium]
MRVSHPTRDRGFVLLVALGVLGVLGLLAATFATLSRVERAVSSSYVDKVRAKMLAQSGIERAIASIRGRAMIQAWDDTRNDWYYREMLNGAVGGITWTPAVIASLGGYTPTRAYGTAPRNLETVVDTAITTGTPGGISFPDVSVVGVSGTFPGTYEPNGDVYALKILDCASMLYVNDQNPEIKRMLNQLGTILNINTGFSLGDEIVSAAKTRGKPWNNKSEILDQVFIAKLGATEGRKRFLVARDFITCHAWMDLNTMHFGPKPALAMGEETGETRLADATVPTAPADASRALATASAPYAVSPMFNIQSRMTGTYPTLPGSRFLPVTTIPGLPVNAPIDQGGMFAQFITGQGAATVAGKFGGSNHWVQPRAPINVNTASREVLVAMLWGLTASFVDYNHPTGTLQVRAVSISKTQAETAADYIVNGRYTHGTPAGAWGYNDWMHFRQDVIDTIPGLDRFQTALIHANCNPNTEIKKLNPDLLLVDSNPRVNSQDFVRLDKSDITVKSTELTFCSGGFYEIEALGRVYNSGRIMSEEKIETVVKVYDVLRYTNQEQFEKDRNWTNDDSAKSEGSLLAGGFPPVVSMPEYPYAAGTMSASGKLMTLKAPANPYRSTTGDFSWAADYDGYLILNGPAKVVAGTSPGDFNSGAKCRSTAASALPPDQIAPNTAVNGCYWKNSGEACKISFINGFNMGTLRPQQSHANTVANSQKHLSPNPTNPEYSYSCPNCDGTMYSYSPVNTLTMDTDYKSAYYSPKMPYQISPGAAVNRTITSTPSLGSGFMEGGADLQPFGVYVNYLKRRRFLTYWADELPTGSFTVEFMYKPELDHWEWAKGLPKTAASLTWDAGPCAKMHLWGIGAASDGSNAQMWVYVWGSRVYFDLKYNGFAPNYVMFADHAWRAHTWHHIEFGIEKEHRFTKSDGTTITVPHNAMLFVDGVPASGVLGGGLWMTDTNPETVGVYGSKAMKLPTAWISATPNNNVSSGPRMEFLSKLQYTPGYGMSKSSTCGTGDNLVIHHWRSHDAPFTPRNRYHSVSYYDGSTYKSGVGYKLEKAGVYKKRLTFLEGVAATGKDVTIGTLSCTHYHPFHVHLYGHDGIGAGGPPPTSFGHITPALRIKTGGSYIDNYYYDGCAGLPIKAKAPAGSELYYLGWFEIASLVPVTMSPILGDISLTYFTEPKTYFRLSSSEAK